MKTDDRRTRRKHPLRAAKQVWANSSDFMAASKSRIALLIAASILEGFLEAGVLYVLVQLALAISSGRDGLSIHLGPLHATDLAVSSVILIAVVLSLVRFAMQFVTSRLPARMSSEAQVHLRHRTIEAFLNADWKLQSNEREGALQDLLSTQIGRAVNAVLLLTEGVTSFFNFSALLVSAIVVNPVAALAVLVAVTGLFFLLRPVTRVGRRYSKQLAKANRRYAEGISELVRMTEEVKVFGVAGEQQRHLDELVDDVARPYFRSTMLSSLVPSLYQSVAVLIVITGLGVLYQVASNRLAALGAVVLILIRALTYSGGLQNVYHRLNDVAPNIEIVRRRIREFAEAREEHKAATSGAVHTLSFRNVSFEYVPGRPVLRDVSFDISAGEAIGIVGPSGAGKSTLVQLLLRLREPTSGDVLVNELPSKDLSIDEWRERVAYVPQDSRVLTGTVADNIRFMRTVDDDSVRQAALEACIHDDIIRWRAGYDTAIGQRADAVSGGQRQRLTLARALCAHPDVLILDEPTSALDMQSEAGVQESLVRLKGRVTLFVVAHRMSTLSICDRIMVFRDGILDDFATPEELLSSNEFYRAALDLSRQGR